MLIGGIGRGYAGEALVALCRFLINLEAHRIYIQAFVSINGDL